MQHAIGVDFEREILRQHLAAFEELTGNESRNRAPVDRCCSGDGGDVFLMGGSDFEKRVQTQRRIEANGAEIAEVGKAQLVEVVFSEEAVVDEEELDSGLDGGDAAALVDDADEGVAGEDFG